MDMDSSLSEKSVSEKRLLYLKDFAEHLATFWESFE